MGSDTKTMQRVFLSNVSAKQIRRVSGRDCKELYGMNAASDEDYQSSL